MTKEQFNLMQAKYAEVKKLRHNASKIAHLVEHGNGCTAVIEANGTLEIEYTAEMIKELHSFFLENAAKLEKELFD